MLLRILSVVFPVFAVVGVGWLYGRFRKPDMSTANMLNMDLFTPMLIFSTLAVKQVPLGDYVAITVAGGIVVMGTGLLGWPLAKLFRQQEKTLLPAIMFKNSGNMGLPLMLLAFGEAAMPAAIALFLIENFLHFSFGAWWLDHRVKLTNLWKVPVLFAGLAGFVVGHSGIPLWEPLAMAIRMLGDICIPLMLFSLGVRLTEASWQSLHAGLLGAIACPLLGMLVAAVCMPFLDAQQGAMLLVFGALPPAVLNYIFAERYRQEPDKVAAIVLAGNAASIIIMPIALAIALR